ncbi:MAG: hypothetical protein AAFP90_14685, partial [Planctomycetota bacterium]
MLNRRSLLQGIAAGTGAALGLSLSSRPLLAASGGSSGAPRRIVFFLQNQGFHPDTCTPKGMKHSGSLAGKKLPQPIEALEPYKDRLHIIGGLHGRH